MWTSKVELNKSLILGDLNMKIRIGVATENDIDSLVHLANQLYHSDDDLHEEFDKLLKDDDAVVFLACDQNKNIVGFAQDKQCLLFGRDFLAT